MSQSEKLPHVAIVMDGNGRWAEKRGLPRRAGHQAGAGVVRRVVEAAPGLGIGTLTLYAFSSDNWKRPLPEVAALMQLFARYLRDETARCLANGVALNVIGRRDRLAIPLRRAIEEAEAKTAAGTNLLLRIAIDYSGRDAIRRAALSLAAAGRTECDLDELGVAIGAVDHSIGPVPPVDVLIRTGGDHRLSDFMLWEGAYAELFFRREPWPDFRAAELAAIMAEFRGRQRRFGGLDPAGFAPEGDGITPITRRGGA